MNDFMLHLNDVSLSYKDTKAVSKVSLSVKKGEILGIVGETGSGKTTLLKSILPLDEFGIQKSGTIVFENKHLLTMHHESKRKLLGKHIGMIFQHPKASFNPTRCYKDQFKEALMSHNMYEKAFFYQKVDAIFKKLGLEDTERILASRPFEMSGGMNQRIAISLAVLLETSLLLADEPTSALDLKSQVGVMDEICRMRDIYKTTVIFVTHNIDVVAKIADRIGVMYQGRLIEIDEASKIVTDPQHPYTRKLIDAVPKLKDYQSVKPLDTRETILELRALGKVFPHRVSAVNDISLSVKKGEILGIVGESGSGKSTLLKLIAGLEKNTTGEALFLNKDIALRVDYKAMQMVFQHPHDSFNPKKIMKKAFYESLANHLNVRKRKEADDMLRDLMNTVGLDFELLNKYPHELSGGQCQRAAIARAICVKPQLLLCDEITSSLDASVQAEVVVLIKKLAETMNMAVIFVSHDIALVSQLSHRLLVLKNGDCVEHKETQAILDAPEHPYTKELIDLARRGQIWKR